MKRGVVIVRGLLFFYIILINKKKQNTRFFRVICYNIIKYNGLKVNEISSL